MFFRINWRAWIFFHLIFPCAYISFLCFARAAPPDKFFNGPSLLKLVLFFDKWQEIRHSAGTRWNSRCRIPPISVSSGRNGHERQWRLHLRVDLNSLVPILQKTQTFYLNVVHFYNLERRETWERQLWAWRKLNTNAKRDDRNASWPQVVLVGQGCFFSCFYHYSKVIQVHWQVSMILFILNSSGCS